MLSPPNLEVAAARLDWEMGQAGVRAAAPCGEHEIDKAGPGGMGAAEHDGGGAEPAPRPHRAAASGRGSTFAFEKMALCGAYMRPPTPAGLHLEATQFECSALLWLRQGPKEDSGRADGSRLEAAGEPTSTSLYAMPEYSVHYSCGHCTRVGARDCLRHMSA
ncbi:hypothetical protein GH5_04279 [Leishmania sp. Ghana 2012 LV757]|uniref:hypothetical protein n=1 Tax=Leishmania sp. Ghana 2012 LV757 TaxID=2803181 RepID=UPI001B3DD4B9|nr:hypothetical protein GH5_04279 [Leishmania sp. Ghana 2012 LV757]